MADIELVIKIPEEQIKKSLEESKSIHEDEGEKGSVHIEMLYTNGRLDFVDVSRKKDFYSCEYKILPKGHGNLIDISNIDVIELEDSVHFIQHKKGDEVDVYINAPIIIEADKE